MLFAGVFFVLVLVLSVIYVILSNLSFLLEFLETLCSEGKKGELIIIPKCGGQKIGDQNR